MAIGIIGAMDEEIEWLKKEMEDREEQATAGSLFIKGKLEGQEVVLVKSGIGKVNAAVATAVLLQLYNPEIVINTGSAGGFHKDLNVGDIVISTEVRYHDVDVTSFGYDYGQVPQMPPAFLANAELVKAAVRAAEQIPDVRVTEGLIATGDSFMSDAERVAFVTSKFPELLAAEMEGAAIAQTCQRFGVPFVIIRSLSDIAGKDSEVSFNQFLHKAAEHSSAVVHHMLREIPSITSGSRRYRHPEDDS